MRLTRVLGVDHFESLVEDWTWPLTELEFKRKTKLAALSSIAFVDALPRQTAAQVIGKQFIRCATSVGANYRAACRAKSVADMVAKLAIVEEEADEAVYWLEL